MAAEWFFSGVLKYCRLSASVILFPVAGAALVLLVDRVPSGWLQITVSGWTTYLVAGLSGFLMGAVLLFPGLSVKAALEAAGLSFGVEQMLRQPSLLWIPLGVGGILGLFAAAKLLGFCLYRHRTGTCLLFLGMVGAEAFLLFPGFPSGAGWFTGVTVLLLGWFAVLLLDHKKEKQK